MTHPNRSGTKHWNWKGGKPKCLDCGKTLSDYISKRCTEHSKKYQKENIDKNFNWKGNKVGYYGLHLWIKRKLGTPKRCEFCGRTDAKKFEWASKDHRYSRDLTDWIRLCTSCHRRYDYGMISELT